MLTRFLSFGPIVGRQSAVLKAACSPNWATLEAPDFSRVRVHGQRRVYTFVNTCREDQGITLDDGMVKVMLSSAGAPTDDIDQDVAAFLEYMNGKITQNGFIEEIDDTIRNVKLDGAKEADYMTFQMMLDEERDEAREEGREAGREEMAVATAIKMLRKGIPAHEIVEFTDLPQERIEELARTI